MTTINLSPNVQEMAEAMQLRVQACEAYGGKAFYPKEVAALETVRDMLAFAYKRGGTVEMETWAADIALAAFQVSRVVKQQGAPTQDDLKAHFDALLRQDK